MSSITAVVVTWRLWPDRWRAPSRRRPLITTLAALMGSYLAVSIGADAGFNRWLDDDVIDKVTKAEIDGTDVWVIGVVVALAVLGAAGLLARRSR